MSLHYSELSCRNWNYHQLHPVVPQTFLHLLAERDYNCSLGSLKITSQSGKTVLLFHCCTGKGAKTKLHQEYPHRKKRIPSLSRKLVFFANRNTPQKMQLLDKIHPVFTAALIQKSRAVRHGRPNERGSKLCKPRLFVWSITAVINHCAGYHLIPA